MREAFDHEPIVMRNVTQHKRIVVAHTHELCAEWLQTQGNVWLWPSVCGPSGIQWRDVC